MFNDSFVIGLVEVLVHITSLQLTLEQYYLDSVHILGDIENATPSPKGI